MSTWSLVRVRFHGAGDSIASRRVCGAASPSFALRAAGRGSPREPSPHLPRPRNHGKGACQHERQAGPGAGRRDRPRRSGCALRPSRQTPAPSPTCDRWTAAATTSPTPPGARPARSTCGSRPANYADGIKAPVSGPPTRYVSNRIFNDPRRTSSPRTASRQWGFVWGQFLDHTFGLRAGGRRRGRADRVRRRATRSRSSCNDFGAIDFMRTPAAPGTGDARPRASRSTRSAATSTARASTAASSERLEWLREGPVDGDMSNNGATPAAAATAMLPRRDAAATPRPRRRWRSWAGCTGTPDKAMVAGDVRANENIALTATHTLFAREHNRIVDRAAALAVGGGEVPDRPARGRRRAAVHHLQRVPAGARRRAAAYRATTRTSNATLATSSRSSATGRTA